MKVIYISKNVIIVLIISTRATKKEIRGASKDLPIRVPQTVGFIYPQTVGLLPSQILEKPLSFVLY